MAEEQGIYVPIQVTLDLMRTQLSQAETMAKTSAAKVAKTLTVGEGLPPAMPPAAAAKSVALQAAFAQSTTPTGGVLPMIVGGDTETIGRSDGVKYGKAVAGGFESQMKYVRQALRVAGAAIIVDIGAKFAVGIAQALRGNFEEAAKEFKSVPLLGQLFGAGQDIRELFTHEREQLDAMKKDAEDIAKYMQAAASIRFTGEGAQQSLHDVATQQRNRAKILGAATPEDADLMRINQDAGSERQRIEREAKKAIEGVGDKYHDELVSIDKELSDIMVDAFGNLKSENTLTNDEYRRRSVLQSRRAQLNRLAKQEIDAIGQSAQDAEDAAEEVRQAELEAMRKKIEKEADDKMRQPSIGNIGTALGGFSFAIPKIMSDQFNGEQYFRMNHGDRYEPEANRPKESTQAKIAATLDAINAKLTTNSTIVAFA